MRVLTTNGANTHSPDTWAYATARELFDVAADGPEAQSLVALKFQSDVANYMLAHHAAVQADEQTALDADPAAQFTAAHDVDRYVSAAVEGIVALAAGLPFADKIICQRDGIAGVIGTHFATSQHIHRQAHARTNPGIPEGQAFLASLTASPEA